MPGPVDPAADTAAGPAASQPLAAGPDGLRISWGATTLVLGEDGVEVRVGDCSVRLTAAGAELVVAGGGRLSIQAEEAILAVGAASLRLRGGTVSVNDGALDVT